MYNLKLKKMTFGIFVFHLLLIFPHPCELLRTDYKTRNVPCDI